MDQLLQMIQSADPTDNQSDSVELLQLEGNLFLNNVSKMVRVWEKVHITNVVLYCKAGLMLSRIEISNYDKWFYSSGACNQMGPLIDQKLEDIDRCRNNLYMFYHLRTTKCFQLKKV